MLASRPALPITGSCPMFPSSWAAPLARRTRCDQRLRRSTRLQARLAPARSPTGWNIGASRRQRALSPGDPGGPGRRQPRDGGGRARLGEPGRERSAVQSYCAIVRGDRPSGSRQIRAGATPSSPQATGRGRVRQQDRTCARRRSRRGCVGGEPCRLRNSRFLQQGGLRRIGRLFSDVAATQIMTTIALSGFTEVVRDLVTDLRPALGAGTLSNAANQRSVDCPPS